MSTSIYATQLAGGTSLKCSLHANLNVDFEPYFQVSKPQKVCRITLLFISLYQKMLPCLLLWFPRTTSRTAYNHLFILLSLC